MHITENPSCCRNRLISSCDFKSFSISNILNITNLLWDLVHEIMKNRRRETKRGEVQMVAGLVNICRLRFGTQCSYNSKRQAFTSFSCWVYKNYGKKRCTSHSIGYKTLYNIVLEDIRRQRALRIQKRIILQSCKIN